jgi:hypothetical protein
MNQQKVRGLATAHFFETSLATAHDALLAERGYY